MNSHRRRPVIYAVVALLLAGTIVAVELRNVGGGGQDSRSARHFVRRSKAALTPSRTAARTAGPASPPARQPASGRARASSPDQLVSTAGAVQAVAGFMRGFLAWSLGRGPARTIQNATQAFIAQAGAHPPELTPAERHERIRVARIRVLSAHPPVAVVDLAPSIGARFELDFYLVHRHRRWLVSGMATPG